MTLEMSSPRLKHWGLITIFSAIFLSTTLTTFSPKDRTGDIKFDITTASISVILGPLFIACTAWGNVKGKPNILTRGGVELGASSLILLCWCVVIGVDEKNHITFDEDGHILNANLYYFSWLALLSSVMLCLHNSVHYFGKKIETGDETRFILWVFIFTSNIVLMSSSIPENGYFDKCVEFCKRLFFGAMLGGCTAFVSFGILLAYHKGLNPNKYCQVELVFSLLIVIGYCFGIFAITSDGPGSIIGNIYYSAWTSFILSILLFIDCFHAIDVEKIKRRLGIGSPEKVETPEKIVEDKTETPVEKGLEPVVIAAFVESDNEIDIEAVEVSVKAEEVKPMLVTTAIIKNNTEKDIETGGKPNEDQIENQTEDQIENQTEGQIENQTELDKSVLYASVRVKLNEGQDELDENVVYTPVLDFARGEEYA